VTAGAVGQSSASPPPRLSWRPSRRISFSVRQQGGGDPRVIAESGHFAVNLLRSDQIELADRFGGRTGVEGEERFFGRHWTVLASGAPALIEACAVFDCRLEARLSVATHEVIIGAVTAVRRTAGSEPLAMSVRDYAADRRARGQAAGVTAGPAGRAFRRALGRGRSWHRCAGSPGRGPLGISAWAMSGCP
jgi:flavin reductase (DIM6/NTAB) family NADH-FMN oxidoreductase RutF